MRNLRAKRPRNNAERVASQCAGKLLKLRGDTGETQAQLAKRVRMTESMISRLESGNHVPNLRTLCRLADVFGRQLEVVFHEHEHTHVDGTRHTHPHNHIDSNHRHGHGGRK